LSGSGSFGLVVTLPSFGVSDQDSVPAVSVMCHTFFLVTWALLSQDQKVGPAGLVSKHFYIPNPSTLPPPQIL
jgi:hypothetical protein